MVMKQNVSVKLLCSAICLLHTVYMAAQNVDDDSYRYDVGLNLGISSYIGEANTSLFGHAGFGGMLSMRYMPNSRMAFRGALSMSSVSGDTADGDNVFPGNENYRISAQVYDLSVRYEFNFFAYGIGETYKKLRRWTPYIMAGVGATLSSCDGYTSVAPSIPLGVGVKFKLRPRWNLMAEFSMTKVFGDHVDGKGLSDMTGIKSSFVKNTDWMSMISVGISYEFSKRCSTCHYVD